MKLYVMGRVDLKIAYSVIFFQERYERIRDGVESKILDFLDERIAEAVHGGAVFSPFCLIVVFSEFFEILIALAGFVARVPILLFRIDRLAYFLLGFIGIGRRECLAGVD